MTEIARPRNVHKAYHAHIYFAPPTVEQARALREAVLAGFEGRVSVGRFHEKIVGPHPHWSCQFAFSQDNFDAFIPWLDAHRGGLDVLVHGLTGNDIEDHTTHAYWLGDPQPLNLAALSA